MSPLRQALYGGALLAALTLLLWTQHLRTANEEAAAALGAHRQREAEERIERDANTITSLRDSLSDERDAQVGLQLAGQDLRRELDVRKQQIKELKRENTELREWADVELPAAARRLRERPAITGAANYRNWLSGRNAVHIERN